VPPDAVRVEEMMNYFNFGYTDPLDSNVFSFHSQLTGCPWNKNNQLLLLKVCARKINPDRVPASNLVFLIDVSGSMDMPNRLPLLKAAFNLMITNLREKDTVSIVTYGSSANVWMQPTSGKEKKKIRQAIEDLYPGGATSGSSGIQAAYKIAKSQFIRRGNNRVILATDGDFNVGQTSDSALERMITQNKQSGIYLTCLGVGMGNYKDSKLEVLAKKGNGNFAYLDDEKEAEKVLVKELTQTLYTVADEAYLNIQFNAACVKDYLLIGFDNKLNAVEDSLSELEGGEVGSGHSLLTLFEITPAKATGENENLLAKVTMNYKCPLDTARKKAIYNCPGNYKAFTAIDSSYQFAASVALFGYLLKHPGSANKNSWNDLMQLANQSYSREDGIQKEFMMLIEKAKKIYSKRRK
jgi:Ca-activated chloride channel family protein